MSPLARLSSFALALGWLAAPTAPTAEPARVTIDILDAPSPGAPITVD
jgi:hypothetical protein